ncbi:YgjV family protein [Aridibaculum aurantiacum]|uniref:YgjV family protein n=1 Tax=Aridibaculum aurantiacum TaxID=2810307 RepID=UPI001A96C0B8|nr:YgjV family protein [Aridibaculum aurantiacum]
MDIVISLFGYLASVLLAISLIVNNDLKFRWLNTFGCMAFIVYGVLLQAFPIILTNSILLLINVYRIYKIHQTHENFDMVEFAADDQVIDKFIQFYRQDINAYFPQFTSIDPNAEIRFAVLRDMVIANIFVAKLSADGTANVLVNYTVPKYRDFQVGKYIFDREKKYLKNKGVNKIVYDQPVNKAHMHFLKVMGFATEEAMGKPVLVKTL